MGGSFRLTEDALLDLEQAVSYLAQDSEAAALKLADDLESTFIFIAQWPGCGHRRSYITGQRQVRFWNSAGFLIAYQSLPKSVLIIAVLHGARDAASLLATRFED